MRWSVRALAAVAALSLAACEPQAEERSSQQREALPAGASEPSARAGRVSAGLDELFAQAAEEYGVPAELLKAISHEETRWEMVRGEVEFEGMPAAYGLLALRGEALSRGAALAGETEEAVRSEPLANLRAGAALLSAYARELGVERSELGAWAPAVARLSGIENAAARAQYIHEGVYGVLRRGAVAYEAQGGTVASLMPVQVQARYELPRLQALAAGPDYAAAIWRPSPNYGARPTGPEGVPSMVVIHTCEGSYSGCWSWLTKRASRVSAHYVVKEDGAEISQLVREADRAWHVGATYDCSLNGGVRCDLNGFSVNHFSVGIEHGGYASQSSFPSTQIEASAQLVCDITRDRSIPIDSYHIVSHARLQPGSRVDPGPNWPWGTYLSRISSYCGSSALVIDSHAANNDSTKGYVEASSSWLNSTSNPGYYGSGYLYASTQAVEDPFTFWFYLPEPATRTVDAWWTAGSNRSTSAPFLIYDATGARLATVYANQQVEGGRWNTLGTWSFPAGWSKVQLSRVAPAGYVVIADAIQIR